MSYGISEIFGANCIYSTLERNVIDQIINMQQFRYELLEIDENKIMQLFGINDVLDRDSYIYNKSLISFSNDNSILLNDEIPNEEKNDINYNEKIDKNLINLSSELFLFNYIIKQFEKKDLIQLPRTIFFCSLNSCYNDEYFDIYEFQKKSDKLKENKIENKKEEKTENKIEVNPEDIKEGNIVNVTKEVTISKKEEKIESKNEIKKEDKEEENSEDKKKVKFDVKVSKENDERKKNQIKIMSDETTNQKIRVNTSQTMNKNKILINNNNNMIKGNGKNQKEQEKERYKKIFKCVLLDFAGTLEIDGAFKYIGQKKELNCDSLKILLSEYLNKGNNIKKFAEIFEAEEIIYKYDHCDSKEKSKFQSKIKGYKTVNKEQFDEKNIINTIENLRDKAKEKLIKPEEKLIFKPNDIILIENKREYPKNYDDEISNFIEHSFYFIRLYKNLNVLKEDSEIFLLFIYDNSKNHKIQKKAYIQLNALIEKNSLKLNKFSNNIKCYLIHSLPNLSVSVFDKLDNEINENKTKINDLTSTIATLRQTILRLENEITQLKNERNGAHNIDCFIY